MPISNKKRNERYAKQSEFKKWADRNKSRYSLSTEQLIEIWEQTNCDICEVILTRGNVSRNRKTIDHCHETGEVRGVLCHDCNIALGNFKDSPELLSRAIKYLDND